MQQFLRWARRIAMFSSPEESITLVSMIHALARGVEL
jgi:hypothetical protein